MAIKKLSICIATYNRANLIGQTLESILSQVTDAVEVLVVDGASTDNTTEIVTGYGERFKQLRYVRLPAKGGVDQDFDRAVELAEGEYCWLFSDDDLLKPGAVQRVLAAIQNDYTLVIVNAEISNVDFSEKLAERKLPAISDHIYEDNDRDKERFFAEVGDYLTFIGCVVIRRDIWLSRNRSKYYGSRFIHVGVIFQSPLPGKVFVIAKPFITIRLGNAEWASLGFEIWMFKWPELIWSFSDFSDISKSAVCRQRPWQRIRILIYYRAMGIYSLPEYSKYLSQCLRFRGQRFFARIIAKIPFGVANGLMRFYAMVHNNKLLMYTLKSSSVSYSQMQK